MQAGRDGNIEMGTWNMIQLLSARDKYVIQVGADLEQTSCSLSLHWERMHNTWHE